MVTVMDGPPRADAGSEEHRGHHTHRISRMNTVFLELKYRVCSCGTLLGFFKLAEHKAAWGDEGRRIPERRQPTHHAPKARQEHAPVLILPGLSRISALVGGSSGLCDYLHNRPGWRRPQGEDPAACHDPRSLHAAQCTWAACSRAIPPGSNGPRRGSPSATYGLPIASDALPRPGKPGPSAAWVSSYTRCGATLTASYAIVLQKIGGRHLTCQIDAIVAL